MVLLADLTGWKLVGKGVGTFFFFEKEDTNLHLILVATAVRDLIEESIAMNNAADRPN